MTQGPVHFIGIGGIGMSAMARVLLARGVPVSGSDASPSALLGSLREAGASVHVGHREENVRAASRVVVSSAIPETNPEYRAAAQAGIPIARRGDMLAEIVSERRVIAVAGTHGKTTVTAMAARVLGDAGLDPSFIVGGEMLDGKPNGHNGAGAWFLTEADESDGSFLALRPQIAVVTNIENDHVSGDERFAELRAAFRSFVSGLPADGVALIGIDCPESAALAEERLSARTLTFGCRAGARLQASDIRFEGFGSRFEVRMDGARLGTIALRVPGEINIANAFAATAIGLQLDVPFERIAAALQGFEGVRRRFEFLVRSPHMTVVDDYAHHPTAVAATLALARRAFSGPISVAFQPHRYTRTRYLAADFARALEGPNPVYLTPVYAASEEPIPGIDARTIGEPLRERGTDVRYVADVAELPARLLAETPAGGLALMLGAGDISSAAAQLARLVEHEAAAPLAARAW